MAIAANAVGLYLGTRDEVINSAAHIQNVFPRHTLAGDGVAQEFKAFVRAATQTLLWVLPFLKAKCIRAEHHVAKFGQCRAGVVHWVARKAGGLGLAEVPLPGVLMPNGDARRWGLVAHTIGHEQDGRAAVVGLEFVAQPNQFVAVLLLGLLNLRLQIAALGPRSTEAL